jgi:glycosyltransferase involved in cell wall biosynthesis
MSARVSLTIMVKNEEANVSNCLRSVAGLVDEMVVIDTGSSDRTKELAAGLGARVHDFAWTESFADGRNEGIRRASHPWIFMLDADDRVDEENRRLLRELFGQLTDQRIAYIMKQVSPSKTHSGTVVYDQVRLWPNDPQVRWRYRIHEQISPSLAEHGIPLQPTNIRITHLGYQDAVLEKEKYERNLRLLHRDNAEHPGDPFILYYIAATNQSLGRLSEAMTYARQSVERAGPQHFFAPNLYAMLARGYRQLGQTAEAYNICREGLARFPDDAALLFQYAWLLYLMGNAYGTESCLLQLVQSRTGRILDSGEASGYRGYLTRHNLAILYRDQQRFAEAEAQWQAALAERPDCVEAMLGLGELYLGQQRWADMEQVLRKLEENPATEVHAAVLRAQQLLEHHAHADARRVIDAAIAKAPGELGPRLVLSRLLWQEGRDWAATEQALRDVLAIAPNHPEAIANLARLGRA